MIIALLDQPEGTSALSRIVEPWANLYSDSRAVSAAVLFLHLVPLVVAGGTAWVADRATLRAARGEPADRMRQLVELAGTHRLVVGGLALSLISGVLMFASDVDTFLPSPFFWTKLVLVALLLANGFLITRTERALEAGGDEGVLWGRLRTLAILSGTLWLVTTLAGVVLASYA